MKSASSNSFSLSINAFIKVFCSACLHEPARKRRQHYGFKLTYRNKKAIQSHHRPKTNLELLHHPLYRLQLRHGVRVHVVRLNYFKSGHEIRWRQHTRPVIARWKSGGEAKTERVTTRIKTKLTLRRHRRRRGREAPKSQHWEWWWLASWKFQSLWTCSSAFA